MILSDVKPRGRLLGREQADVVVCWDGQGAPSVVMDFVSRRPEPTRKPPRTARQRSVYVDPARIIVKTRKILRRC